MGRHCGSLLLRVLLLWRTRVSDVEEVGESGGVVGCGLMERVASPGGVIQGMDGMGNVDKRSDSLLWGRGRSES